MSRLISVFAAACALALPLFAAHPAHAVERAPAAGTSVDDGQPDPESFKWSIGFEGPGLNTSVFSQNAVYVGRWLTNDFGVETYFGYSKTAGNLTTTTAVANSGAGTVSQTTTTNHTGAEAPKYLIIGAAPRYRVYQSKIFQVNLAFLMAYTFGTTTKSATGTLTETVADTSNPGNADITDTTGLSVVNYGGALRFGPKINVETYLPFLKHVSVGFTTGIFLTAGGDTTTTTTTGNKHYTRVNGVDQTPTGTPTSTTTTNTVEGGGASNTYSIGGTGLGFGQTNYNPITVAGTFVLRYEF